VEADELGRVRVEPGRSGINLFRGLSQTYFTNVFNINKQIFGIKESPKHILLSSGISDNVP
jgi:hypothetical protein